MTMPRTDPATGRGSPPPTRQIAKRRRFLSAARIVLRAVLRAGIGLALISLAGCGGEPPAAGIAAVNGQQADPLADPGPLRSQLVDVPVTDDPAVDALSGNSDAQPLLIYLAYADGNA